MGSSFTKGGAPNVSLVQLAQIAIGGALKQRQFRTVLTYLSTTSDFQTHLTPRSGWRFRPVIS